MPQGNRDVFSIGDIIKHRRSDTLLLVVDIKSVISRNMERIEYIAVGMGDGIETIIHYPLMAVNYEKVDT